MYKLNNRRHLDSWSYSTKQINFIFVENSLKASLDTKEKRLFTPIQGFNIETPNIITKYWLILTKDLTTKQPKLFLNKNQRKIWSWLRISTLKRLQLINSEFIMRKTNHPQLIKLIFNFSVKLWPIFWNLIVAN